MGQDQVVGKLVVLISHVRTGFLDPLLIVSFFPDRGTADGESAARTLKTTSGWNHSKAQVSL